MAGSPPFCAGLTPKFKDFFPCPQSSKLLWKSIQTSRVIPLTDKQADRKTDTGHYITCLAEVTSELKQKHPGNMM